MVWNSECRGARYEWGTRSLCYSQVKEAEFYSEVVGAGGSGELNDLMQQSYVFSFEL